MAKRFTDTNKWDKSSFQSLPLKMKLVWVFLCDRCDHAGIWDINLPLISFMIGETVACEEIKQHLGDKVHFISAKKLFIPSFVEFQYGELNDANRAHKSVMNILEKEGAYKGLKRSLQGRKDMDKDKDKDLDKCIKGGLGEKSDPQLLIEIWNSNCGELPKIKALNPEREKKIKKHFADLTPEQWAAAILSVSQNPFCQGHNDRQWMASFDWFLGKDKNGNLNFIKAHEGNYEIKSSSKSKVEQQNDKFAEMLTDIREGRL